MRRIRQIVFWVALAATAFVNEGCMGAPLRALKKAARGGEVEAQFVLGCSYYSGAGVSQDDERAVLWFTKAAEQGHAASQYLLGDCYYNGTGVSQDYKQAALWFTKAAEQGHKEAQFSLANCYGFGLGVSQDYARAIQWYNKATTAAGGGFFQSLVAEVNPREVSLITPKQIPVWLIRAAEEGVTEAQFILGNGYYTGIGITQDHKAAAIWFAKAAEQGHVQAQFLLANCYGLGNGVPVDYQAAIHWYTQAIDTTMATPLFSRKWPPDNEDAVKWLVVASSKGRPNIQYYVGNCYARSKKAGGFGDHAEAAVWYAMAAEQGHVTSQTKLGACYARGKGVPQDYEKAARWYTKAAMQGNATAQKGLSYSYLFGEGVPQDDVESYAWKFVAALNEEPRGEATTPEWMTPEQVEQVHIRAKELIDEIKSEGAGLVE